MKKNNVWKIRGRKARAVFGAFALAVAGMSALACDGATNPPTNKPPDVPEEPTTLPDVTLLAGARIGDSKEIVRLTWTNPAKTSTFENIEVTFTPECTGVTQPIVVEKTETHVEIEGLLLLKSYKFYIKTMKGESKSDGKNVTVAGATVDINEAIKTAQAAATGAGTVDAPRVFTLQNADLSTDTNIALVFSTLTNDSNAYFELNLAENNSAAIWNRYLYPGAAKVVNLILPDTVTEIADDLSVSDHDAPTFSAFTQLREISGAGVEIIGRSAFFSGSRLLKTARFPEALTIRQHAFSSNNGLLEIIDAPKVESLGDNAFYRCGKLVEANFPKVKEIGLCAFYGCESLTEENVNFDALEIIGYKAFERAKVSGDSQTYTGPNFTNTKRTDNTLVFPKVTTIGDRAFYGQFAMAGAYFPEATSIGNEAFRYCEALTEENVDFDKVTKIGTAALAYDDAAASATLGTVTGRATKGPHFTSTKRTDNSLVFPKVTTIGEGALYGQFDMADAYFPEATSIGKNAFRYCELLNEENVDFDKVTEIGTAAFYFDRDTFHSATHTGPAFTSTKRQDDSLVFPKVTTIGEDAFNRQLEMADAYFPKATSIGKNAFRYCELLTQDNVDFDKVTEIGETAFYYDSATIYSASHHGPVFASLMKPDPIVAEAFLPVFPALLTVGKQAFYAQPALVEVDLPTVTSVGEKAFQNCTALVTVNLPAVTTTIAADALSGSAAITTINLPALTSFATAAIATGLFANRALLETVDISAVTAIPAGTFLNCPALTTVKSAATDIGANAFKQCKALDALYVGATPPTGTTPLQVVETIATTNTNTFSGDNAFVIYVPAGSDSGAAATAAWLAWRGDGEGSLGALFDKVTVEVAPTGE